MRKNRRERKCTMMTNKEVKELVLMTDETNQLDNLVSDVWCVSPKEKLFYLSQLFENDLEINLFDNSSDPEENYRNTLIHMICYNIHGYEKYDLGYKSAEKEFSEKAVSGDYLDAINDVKSCIKKLKDMPHVDKLKLFGYSDPAMIIENVDMGKILKILM